MNYHLGFDRAAVPDAEQLAWLKANTGLGWCGFYLAPSPSHPDTQWMDKRDALVAQGWGLAPIYVGQQTAGPGSHHVNEDQGDIDGEHAAKLAQMAGFPRPSIIYLDWEDGSSPPAESLAYIGNWVQRVIQCGYHPGLYCSHVLAPLMVAHLGRVIPGTTPRVWVWKVKSAARHAYAGDICKLQPASPGTSGYPADLWQFEQDCVLTLPQTPCDGLELDLSSSNCKDPSLGAA